VTRHRLPSLALSCAVLLASLAAAPAVSASAGSSSAAATRADPGATSGYLEGVDVSHWQGTISWSKVAAAGKQFAMIKASESTDYVDPLYAANRAAAQAVGLWTGAYHFARPSAGTSDAIAEADHFASVVHLGGGDLIPALDIEVTGGLSPSALTAWVTAWLQEASSRFGVKPMIYTSPAFWTKSLADTRTLADAGYKVLWVAHWGVTQPTIPAQNWGGHGWTFWQYDNCGSVPGIAGCVDLDRYHWPDLATQAYSSFGLAAHATGDVKQGGIGGATIGIVRTNFDAAISLEVDGLPAGTTATFDPSTTTDDTAALKVATQAGVTPTGSYRLTITGTALGLSRQAYLSLVVADGVPPTLTAPWVGLARSTTLGSSIPVRISWSASDPSGVAADALQRSVNGGAWSGVPLSSRAATNASSSVPRSGTIGARASATDMLANTSDWVSGATVASAVDEQTSTAIHYSSGWHTISQSWLSGRSLRYTTTPNAWVSYTFTGSSVAWVAVVGPRRGAAWVYVDGRFDHSVFLASTTYHSRRLVWARNWSTSGTHTVKIVAARRNVSLDAFVRLRIT
jgi:GH25 family lysozyme M1 (1,4-beta-N-acetylmuramidase)